MLGFEQNLCQRFLSGFQPGHASNQALKLYFLENKSDIIQAGGSGKNSHCNFVQKF